MLTSHGAGSGGDYATDFSNVEGSHKSSLGIYLTAETYYSRNPGIRLKLDGMQSSNSNARDRVIVMHGADYVTDRVAGRSQGCLVLSWKNLKSTIKKIKRGSIIYAYYVEK
jgi:hypothetical protein